MARSKVEVACQRALARKQTLSLLRHPIVTLMDGMGYPEFAWLAMELCPRNSEQKHHPCRRFADRLVIDIYRISFELVLGSSRLEHGGAEKHAHPFLGFIQID
jgi:hypothetical protein